MIHSVDILHEVMDGGTATSEGRVPRGVHAKCANCELFQTFSLGGNMKIVGGTLGFGKRCHRCDTNNQFMISYDLDSASGKEPIAAYHLIDTSQYAGSEKIIGVIQKATERLAVGDYEGSITATYTLLEKALKIALINLEVDFKETEGNINKLYSTWANTTENIAKNGSDNEKVLLSGLSKVVEGAYKIANASGDRHDSVRPPTRKMAETARDAALCILNFIDPNRP